MDYEKLHKDTITKLQEMVNSGKVTVEIARGICADFIPESEDERTRKDIVFYIAAHHKDDGEKARWIYWLEKQGKKETDEWKEGNIIRRGGILALVIKGRRAMKSNGEIFTVQYPDEWVKAVPNEIEHFLNELEKQGEQNTVVVIPKFRVGDVIRPKGSTAEYTIESISGECYHGKGWGLHISCDDDYELVKQKSTWKPSYKQIHYLSWVANIKLGDSVEEQEVSKHLNELLEDLKKLREE